MTELFDEADKAGVMVEYTRLPLNESMSVADPDGDFVLLDYSLIHSGSREKVHLAHELGHCITGSFYNPYTPYDIRKKHENRADKWAIEELIPEDDLEKVVENGITDAWELAEHFDVPIEFMRKTICWYTHGNLAVDLFL